MKLPRAVYIAVSGGPDSMAALDFLRRNHNVSVIHVNHNTGHWTRDAETMVWGYCANHGITMRISSIAAVPSDWNSSEEHWWSKQRDEIFQGLSCPVVTGHNLEDAVEWWVMSSMRGESHLMGMQNKRVLRPFLLNKKTTMIAWCVKHEVPFLMDPTNIGQHNERSKLRAGALPRLREVYPGLDKMVKKKVLHRMKSAAPIVIPDLCK